MVMSIVGSFLFFRGAIRKGITIRQNKKIEDTA